MIADELARALRAAGLRWKPVSGDRFRIEGSETAGDVFTVSEMTIEAHHYPSGTLLGFNGTTEWALDSIALEAALWLPREDQLRELLRGTFRSLTWSTESAEFQVTTLFRGAEETFLSPVAANAYALALFAQVAASSSGA